MCLEQYLAHSKRPINTGSDDGDTNDSKMII